MNTTQTDSRVHPWENAGLGKAPYRFVGVERRVGPIRRIDSSGLEWQMGAPGQPMGKCDYCGQGIADCYRILSADSREFVVGCDCVRKVSAKGDRVLSDVERVARKQRNDAARKRNAAKSNESQARVRELLESPELRAKLSARPSEYTWAASQGKTALDDAEWLASRCGHAGRVRLIKKLESE